jgi:predicted CoA-substrate-specific enzyme activase
VLDIGGQDTKAIKVTADGQVVDFNMNDKCAAGTGRFLGAASDALEIPLGELGPLAMSSKNPVQMTTTCTVFAESEILGWLAKGRRVEDVVMGVHHGIATRSVGLLRRAGIEPEITFTGGVTRNSAMVSLVSELVGYPVNTNEESQYCGAIGAALFALDQVRTGASAERGMPI